MAESHASRNKDTQSCPTDTCNARYNLKPIGAYENFTGSSRYMHKLQELRLLHRISIVLRLPARQAGRFTEDNARIVAG